MALLLWAACSNDSLPEPMTADCVGEAPTYNNEIRPIIEASCAYSSCHLDASPGRFDSYAGLLPYLEDNSFRQRVITDRANPTQGMPPDYAPADRPRDLSPEELQLIECWLDAGFPE
ncbi:MAG: hypothetical protein D6772_01700 [Bacteroidetes bacterium]|nr:MAG: hypothetical protein D6772_01700 [Bacteroidota bacterium]